jgi:hypothetical protein
LLYGERNNPKLAALLLFFKHIYMKNYYDYINSFYVVSQISKVC